MALWAKSQQLPEEARRQLISVYGDLFPIEVRHHLASWIESKIMTDIDLQNPQHEQYASTFVKALIQEVEAKAISFTGEEFYVIRLKLQDSAAMFREKYAQNSVELYRILRHCLDSELRILQRKDNNASSKITTGYNTGFTNSDAVRIITQQLDLLRQKTHLSGEMLRRMEQEQEAFSLEYHELNKIQEHLAHVQNQPISQQRQEVERQLKLRKEACEQKLTYKLGELLNMKRTLEEKHAENLCSIQAVQSRVLDEELTRWMRHQQLSGNGYPFHNNIDSIQDWCEGLAEVIWLNRQQIKESERLKVKFSLMGITNNADATAGLLSQVSDLLSNSFIIERQPPQVMKTNTRFTAVVRLLVGSKLNVHMTPPQVTVTIVSEVQANSLLKNSKITKNDSCGEILNNCSTMEYQKATRQLTASFRNMQLRKIKRAEKRGSESVMDEKFALLFQTKFSIGGGELAFEVWTLSLPVVVIVHGNQEPHAWATVTWDNAFAEPQRAPFMVPDKVPWARVAETLSVKFQSVAGRGLTEDNMRYLAAKAFRTSVIDDPSHLLLSWSLFCKEPLPERNFTFWEWFYAIMKLTREHLRGLWMDGTIIGFVDRRQTEEMLLQCQRGTFLLRFSDSGMGGVTIAWIGDQGDVAMVQPFTSKDFTIRTLADRISDLENLVFLYPNIPRDQAFGKYYTPITDAQTVTKGYVKPLLVTKIPGWSDSRGSETASLPATPSFYQMNSPASGVASVSPAPGSFSMNRDAIDYDDLIGGDITADLGWSAEGLEDVDEF